MRPLKNGFVPILRSGRWTFLDLFDERIMRSEYDAVGNFSNDFAPVQSGERWGFININGDTHIPFRYELAFPFQENRALVKRGGKFGFINNLGREVVSFRYNDAQSFSNGLAPVERNDLWGYINASGRWAIENRFDWAEPFREGQARVRLNDKWGMINRSGDILDTYPYDFIHDSHDRRILFRTDGKVGYLSKGGTVAIPAQFDAGQAFNEGVAVVEKSGDWGVINRSGSWVIRPRYAAFSSFHEGLAAVKSGGQWGYIELSDTETQAEPRSDSMVKKESTGESLGESLPEDFPLWRAPRYKSYVSIGKGVLEREWHIERSEQIQVYSDHAQIYEQTRYPYELPQYFQREAAEELYRRSVQAARENDWQNLSVALDDKFTQNKPGGNHFHHVENVLDRRALVPSKTEYLVYNSNQEGEHMLSGFMYLLSARDRTPPQIGGPLHVWHYHLYEEEKCFAYGSLFLPSNESCTSGKWRRKSTSMLHVWLINHPEGKFATRMSLPRSYYEQLNLDPWDSPETSDQ
jgi:hypothetical protein